MSHTRSVVSLFAATAALGGCEKSGTKTAPVTQAEADDGWRCWVRDPSEPALPQGDVTHTRSRYRDGTLELDSVNNQSGRGSALRLRFTTVGDHLETTLNAVPIIIKLDTPDASSWTLRYDDAAAGVTFQEKNVVANNVLTVTSIDPGEAGKAATETPVRFLPAPCSVVVAELAKYPPT